MAKYRQQWTKSYGWTTDAPPFGWILVVTLGLIPIFYILFKRGNNRNRQQQNGNVGPTRGRTRESDHNLRNNGEHNSSLKRNAMKNHNYSGIRLLIGLEGGQDFSSLLEPKSLMKSLAQECELYFVIKVKSSSEEETALNYLSNELNIVENDTGDKQISNTSSTTSTSSTHSSTSSNVNTNIDGNSKSLGKISKYKVLFCETDVGKVAIARQLEPDLYVDSSSPNVVRELNRFLQNVVLIVPSQRNEGNTTISSQGNTSIHSTSFVSSNIPTCNSLEDIVHKM